MSKEKMEKNIKSQVQIRNAIEADVPFIFNSWLKSYKGSNACKSISAPIYYQFHHKTIETLLQKCSVKVVCSAADENQVYGYIVYELLETVPVLHYAYVKHLYRNMGLLSMMLYESGLGLENGGFNTHESPSFNKICQVKKLKFIYNPYLAFGVL